MSLVSSSCPCSFQRDSAWHPSNQINCGAAILANKINRTNKVSETKVESYTTIRLLQWKEFNWVKGCFHERSANQVPSIGRIPADPTLQFSWIVLDWKIHLVIAFTINPTLIEERREGSKLLQNKLAGSWPFKTLHKNSQEFSSSSDFQVGLLRRPCPTAARPQSPCGLAEDIEYW